MAWIGAHLSVAGGYFRAVDSARNYGCRALQIFTKNTNQWRSKPLADEDVTAFRKSLRGSHIRKLLGHTSYLINLASPDDGLYLRSIDALTEEVERAERLGLHYLVTHPGAHVASGIEAGLSRVAGALDEVHQRTSGFGVMILLENTAGQGTCLGDDPGHLAKIISATKSPGRLGVCFDTCHAHAAGHALWPAADYEATLKRFISAVGVRRLLAFHLNDSKKGLGSRVDRHTHIGQGEIGLESFRLLVNDQRFRNRPMVIETPKMDDANNNMDPVNLGVLGKLAPTRKARRRHCL